MCEYKRIQHTIQTNNLNNDIVSIIVPVYNVDEYINTCISSILQQTYEKIELILVNDGSTDMSGILCKNWSDKDKRIRYIQQENLGVSAARNMGLGIARGVYVMFVDADDSLDRYAVSKYVNVIKESYAEMLISEYSSNGKEEPVFYINNNTIITSNQAMERVLSPKGFWGAVWSKMFLMGIIKENNILFNTDIKYCEDVLFVYEYLKNVSHIVYLPQRLYKYTYREDSTMRSRVSSIYDKRLDIGKVFEMIVNDKSMDKNVLRIAKSRLVYQDCKIIPDFKEFEGGNTVISTLKKRIRRYMIFFLASDVYSVGDRIKSLIKYFFPSLVYNLKIRQ